MGLLFEERSRSPSGTFLGFGEGSRVQAEVPVGVGGRAGTVSPCHVSQVRPQECGSGESARELGTAPWAWRGGGPSGGGGLEEAGSGVVSPHVEAW